MNANISEQHSIGYAPDYGAFIPSQLDDYPLTPIEFRVYCRVLRRAGTKGGTHFESVPNTAKSIGIETKTLRVTYKILEALGLIQVEHIPGKPSKITPTHYDCWVDPSQVKRIRSEVPKPRRKKTEPAQDDPTQTAPGVPYPNGTRGTLPKRHQGYPTQTAPHEGNPIKGIPFKVPPLSFFPHDQNGEQPSEFDQEEKQDFLFGRKSGISEKEKSSAKKEKSDLPVDRQIPDSHSDYGLDNDRSSVQRSDDRMSQQEVPFVDKATRTVDKGFLDYLARTYPEMKPGITRRNILNTVSRKNASWQTDLAKYAGDWEDYQKSLQPTSEPGQGESRIKAQANADGTVSLERTDGQATTPPPMPDNIRRLKERLANGHHAPGAKPQQE